MNIRLKQMKIGNFKGVKSFELNLDGDNCVIKAENGIGKTTIYDAFLWLFFGKDSSGRKDFELRPLDENNQPIKGLVLAVESSIEFDGTVHTFRKEHHEKVVKGQLRGYETLCWIDEVPKKVGEYSDYIAEIMAEDTFKLLTDLHFFNSKMHWKERRAVLLDVAGEIGTPEGFGELIAALNGRTVDEYKKVLAEQKKRLTKERDEINPRIDELQRGLDEYAGNGTLELESKREAIKAEIAELDAKRNKLFTQEKERQTKIDRLNNLKSQLVEHERTLASDTSDIKNLLNEKANIEAGIAEKQQVVFKASSLLATERSALKNDQAEMDASTARLNDIRDEYTTASEVKVDDTCYACGQKLPQDKIAEVENKRKAKLENIIKRGNEIKVDVENCKKSIADHQQQIKTSEETLRVLESELSKLREDASKRIAQIDEAVNNRSTPDFKQDLTWQRINKNIIDAELEIGKPVSEQLQSIETERTSKASELSEIDKSLAQADRMKKDKARIDELGVKEKELAQQIADVDKQLADIEQYKANQSEMIESAVNGKFKHVEFKLFSELLNGSLEECCEATFKGVPYADMSTGQQIFVGVDIVNVLSAHYGISVPLFIDHAESLTLPIEANSQTIELYAKSKVKTLSVERKGELVNV